MVEERSSSSPLMVLTTSSMGLVIWLSISSGEAPGSRVVMVMVGRSTLGKMSTPSWTKEARPEHHQGGDEHGGEDGPADEDLEEAHRRVGGAAGCVRPSTSVTGAPLKSWDRFETATVSPGFTPVDDLHRGALAGARLDEPLLDLAVGDHEDLADPHEVHDGLRGHERHRGVLPGEHARPWRRSRGGAGRRSCPRGPPGRGSASAPRPRARGG